MPHTIAENLTRLSNAKDAIAAAIVDKGGTIEAGDGFESFADKIEAISGGGGVLISKNITENGTYYAVDDEADGYASVEVDVASGKYNEINCTMQEYEAMESHNIHTIYIVTDGNKTYKYLGNDQIGFEEIPITDRAILNNGKGYECRNELNVSGYNPIDWGKDWELILAFVLTTSSLPSAFSNKQYLCGSTNSYPANVRNPFMEWTNSYITLMYSADGGSSWPNCGYLDNDNYSTFMSLLDPTKGVTNYIKVKHTSGSQHHYDWLHSKDGRKYTKFYECDRTGYPSAIAASGTHFTFGFGDTKNIAQGNGFWMLYDRCALYSEGNLIFGREVIPSAKSFPPNIEALEYIKSEGNSVILTDILPNYDWEVFFDLKAENLDNSGAYEILGINRTNEHFLMSIPYYSGNTCDFQAWSGFTPSSGDSYSVSGLNVSNEINQRNTMIVRRGDRGCIYAKHSFIMTTRTSDDPPVYPIAISGIDENGTIYPYSRGELTIYGIKIYLSGSLLYNFIPAQNKTTERAGLYDLVNGIFYPSSSDFDDFIKGPKVFSTPSVDATLVTKTITENGTYSAVNDNADGYASVTVNTSFAFKGHVALSFPTGGDGGAYIPETKLGLDTSKDFEIIVCVWIGANYTLPSSTIFELIGTGSYNVIRKYPQLEFDNRGIWYAASSNNGSSWDQVGTISAADVSSFLVQGSYNYLKLKYSVTEAKLSVWHSSDGETFTKKGEISITDGISNTTDYPMSFGNTALTYNDRTPFSDDFYIAFDKCKIISEGNLIYGGKVVEDTTLITKTITENGTYTAEDDNADGYNSIDINIYNFFDYTKTEEIKDNKYINSSGTEVSHNDYYISYLIPVLPQKYYVWHFGTSERHTSPTVAFYNSAGEYISAYSHDPTVYSFEFQTPSNTAYIRASVYKTDKASAFLAPGKIFPVT